MRTIVRPVLALLALLLVSAAASPAAAQWTNRYPKVEGYGHHVYLEGYELPALTVGPIDPAPAPDGERVAFASRGWIWVMDLESRVARRVTDGPDIDARPAWSPDGGRLAFVRDDTRDTEIVILDLATGIEEVAVDEEALDLDPAFTADGGALLYASAVAGDIDLWRLDLGTGEKTRLTTDRGLELRPQPAPDRVGLAYLTKRGNVNGVAWASLGPEGVEVERLIEPGAILSQLRPALSPDGRRVAYNVPVGEGDGWELRLASTEREAHTVRLAGGPGALPLTPAFSADGGSVFFVEAGPDERMRLYRVSAHGGPVERVEVLGWDWGAPTGTVRVRTVGPDGEVVAARLGVADASGHPALPDAGQPRFDGQNGRVFVYSPGVVEITVPAGLARVEAARGLAAPSVEATADVVAGEVSEVELRLEPIWDARAAGWLSGDHHFHMNYGGLYRVHPEDVELQSRGEALDVPTPLVANLHNRFGEQAWWGHRDEDGLPTVRFGQEIRSHFLGHLGLLGTHDLFWPWVWGPGYSVYGADDRPNARALAFARAQGGMAVYVHPVTGSDPFGGEGSPPTEMIADAVLGDLDGIELVCLWSDEIGTAEVWYRFLTLGIPVAPTAGTDVMTDFYRTMAVGTTRSYVHTGGATDFGSYLDGLRAGRSFATNGPLLDFRVEGAMPGDAVEGGSADFELTVRSVVPVDRVEVLVNGEVAWEGSPPGVGEASTQEGTLALPEGGWVAARAVGPAISAWPAMDSYAFAHTAPVWIGEVGSTDPAAEARAAGELLRLLEQSTARLRAGYEGVDIPLLEARFRDAREELERRAGTGS